MSDSVSPPHPALVVIARGDQELGSWPESEVRRRLAEGRLLSSDFFWREGLTEWRPLTELTNEAPLSSPPVQPLVFTVHFGSARAVDKLGFVRKGELACSADTIELSGLRHWPTAARLGVGAMGWVLLAMAFSALADAFPHEDAGLLVHALVIMTRLMALIGAPFLAMMLTHYFCVSPSRLMLAKSKLSTVTRRGSQITFLAQPSSASKPVRALFRVESEGIAVEIEKLLLFT